MANVVKRLYAWWRTKSPRDALLETLADARIFEEWEASAYQLDEVLGYDLWYCLTLQSLPCIVSPEHSMHPQWHT